MVRNVSCTIQAQSKHDSFYPLSERHLLSVTGPSLALASIVLSEAFLTSCQCSAGCRCLGREPFLPLCHAARLSDVMFLLLLDHLSIFT